jgi:hypothetical protein
MIGFQSRTSKINALQEEVMHLHEENTALRRIVGNTLRRAGCPEEILAEAIEKAIADEIADHRMMTQEGA